MFLQNAALLPTSQHPEENINRITMLTRARRWLLSLANSIQSTNSYSVLIFSSYVHTLFSGGLFPSGLLVKHYMHFSSFPCVLHAPRPFLLHFIAAKYLVKKNYGAPHGILFSRLQSLPPSQQSAVRSQIQQRTLT